MGRSPLHSLLGWLRAGVLSSIPGYGIGAPEDQRLRRRTSSEKPGQAWPLDSKLFYTVHTVSSQIHEVSSSCAEANAVPCMKCDNGSV